MDGHWQAENPLFLTLELIAAYLVPLSVGVLGYFVQRSLNQQQNRNASLSKLADRRMEIFDAVKDDLNRIYCFIADVGSWKDETPVTLIEAKRRLDRTMHTNRPVWSAETFAAYQDYMQTAFVTHQGPGQDAKIQAHSTEKMRGVPGWREMQWDLSLTGTVHPEHAARYEALVERFCCDLMLR